MQLLFFNIFYSSIIWLEYTRECIMHSGRAVNNLFIYSVVLNITAVIKVSDISLITLRISVSTDKLF